MLHKKKLNLNTIKKIIAEKGFVLKKKKDFFNFKELYSLYYTVLSGIILILIFFLLPLSVDIKEDITLNKQTVDNSSSLDFQKVLDGKSLEDKNLDKDLDIKNLFEDIFSLNEDE